MTGFLSEPGDYQVGELVLDSDMKFAPRFKRPAGSALLYATSSIHRAEPVTAGERLVAITWIESRIADPFTRQIHADILQLLNLLSPDGACAPEIQSYLTERKSDVKGKRLSERVEVGVRSKPKKKKKKIPKKY